MSCSDSSDCNDHGDCIGDTCSCDLGWFGEQCDESGVEEWGDGWKVFVVLFIVIHGLFFLVSASKFYYLLRKEKHLGFRRALCRILLSPKNLSMFSITVVNLLKVLWLSSDPLRFSDRLPRWTERLLFEFVYYWYFCMYCSVLHVLAGLYQGISAKRSCLFFVLQRTLQGILIVALPITLGLIIVKGVRFGERVIYDLGYGLLAAGGCFLALGFTLLGLLLCIYVSRTSESEENIPMPMNSARSRLSILTRARRHLTRELERPENTEDTHVILIVSKEDKQVLCKILTLATLAMLLGAGVAGLFTFLVSNDTDIGYDVVLLMLYVGFAIEALACSFILLVFSTQITVEQKEALKRLWRLATSKRYYSRKIVDRNRKFPNIIKRLEMGIAT